MPVLSQSASSIEPYAVAAWKKRLLGLVSRGALQNQLSNSANSCANVEMMGTLKAESKKNHIPHTNALKGHSTLHLARSTQIHTGQHPALATIPCTHRSGSNISMTLPNGCLSSASTCTKPVWYPEVQYVQHCNQGIGWLRRKSFYNTVTYHSWADWENRAFHRHTAV
jgi:hypothetical protein